MNSIIHDLRTWNTTLVKITGPQAIAWTLVISSLLFWGLHIVRAFGYQFPAWRFAFVPLLLLVTSLTSTVLASIQHRSIEDGIIVASNTKLHSGDGEQFDQVASLDSAKGYRVQILIHRGNWTQVKTRHGHTGWLPSRDVEQI